MSNTGRLKMQKMLCTEGTIAGGFKHRDEFISSSKPEHFHVGTGFTAPKGSPLRGRDPELKELFWKEQGTWVDTAGITTQGTYMYFSCGKLLMFATRH